MARPFKPTLIALAVAASPVAIVALLLFFADGDFSFEKVMFVLVVGPLVFFVFGLFLVLPNINNTARYGVLSDEQKKKDYEKYAERKDE